MNEYMTITGEYHPDGHPMTISVHLPDDAGPETLAAVVRMLFRAGKAALPHAAPRLNEFTVSNEDPVETAILPTMTDIDRTRFFPYMHSGANNVAGE